MEYSVVLFDSAIFSKDAFFFILCKDNKSLTCKLILYRATNISPRFFFGPTKKQFVIRICIGRCDSGEMDEMDGGDHFRILKFVKK